MASVLKSEYNLRDLKISLDSSGPGPMVVCDLERSKDGTTRRLKRWSFPPSAFGLPESIGPGQARSAASFHLPESFGDQLGAQLTGQEQEDEAVLWLHFSRPYGYLGLIPWEQLLEPFVASPILRLPDFVVPPPKEIPTILDVLLWASLPPAETAVDLPRQLGMIVRRVSDAASSHRRIRFQVFTDARSYRPLKARWGEEGLLGDHVRLHDPADFERSARSREAEYHHEPGSLDDAWLRWILETLNGRSVDFVHFVGHGYFSMDCPSLIVAGGPGENNDRTGMRLMGPAPLNLFLNRVGAWAFACSSPEENDSELGLRHLADMMALHRPGAVLFHDLARDRDGRALSRACRLLFLPPPRQPEPLVDAFVYCQPFHVCQAQKRMVESDGPADRAPVIGGEAWIAGQVPALQEGENVPAWLAATQRHIELWNWRLQQLEREEAKHLADGDKISDQIDGIRRALRNIQQQVDLVLREEKKGKS
jgi:hypothetical protein